MRRPVDQPFWISNEFGVPDSAAKFGRHAGVDYAVETGRSVFAPTGGTVTDYVWGDYHGNVIQIFDGRFYYRMMHNSRLVVAPGQRVVEGQLVAYSGATGLGVTGPHVHFDIATEKTPSSFAAFVDPAAWLNGAYNPAPTPSPGALQPYQRRAGTAGVNYRDVPNTSARIRQEFPTGDILDFKGWVRGENIGGNDIWFVGRYTGGYSWSGSFDDMGVHDLDDFNPKPAPTPAPIPTPAPTSSKFTPDSQLVKEVIPSPNFTPGSIVPSTLIVHQWDDPAKHPTLAGVTAIFLMPDGISPHYVVDDSGIYQFVKESDRAWHAGPNGNGIGIGIEFDPNGGEAMYQLGRRLIADIRSRLGNLTITRHSDYMATVCPKFIDLARLEAKPAEPSRDDQQDAEISAIKALLHKIADFLSALFTTFKK